MAKSNATGKSAAAQVARIDDEKFIREIVQSALQQFLEAEMTEYIGADPYERSAQRQGLRNGYKPRTLKLKVGTIELSVPQSRDGQFSTELFGRFQRSEQSFILALMQMYVSGVSTRKVTDITEALCGTSFSSSTVSSLCKGLDEQIGTWKKRDLGQCRYPYLFVDALYEHIRIAGVIVSEGVLIVSGVRADGRREILDVVVADSENEVTWADLFKDLKARGLSGVKLVVSDAHSGLKAAIDRYFQGAAWQRCQVHFMRDAAKKVAFRHRKQLLSDVASVFTETTMDAAKAKAASVADSWRDRSASVADLIDEDIEQCLSVLAFPSEHRRRLSTNNGMERLNEEIRRRTRVIRIFPDEKAAIRVIATLCIEKSEEWVTGKRYLDMSLLDKKDRTAGIMAMEELKKVG